MGHQPLFFLHIPKTAGLSLHWAMVNNFPIKRAVRISSEKQLWETPIRTVRRLSFLSAHAHYGFHGIFRKKPFVFTFLRSPESRTISAYWHLRSENPKQFQDEAFREIIEECQNRSLEDILLDHNSQVLGQLGNIQTWYLSGNAPPRKRARINGKKGLRVIDLYEEIERPGPLEQGERELQQAKDALDELPLFGIMERLKESLEILQQRLGFDPSAMPTINVRRSGLDARPLSEAARTRIREIAEVDWRLYEYALKRFDQRAGEMAEKDTSFRPFQPATGTRLPRYKIDRHVRDGFVGGGWYPRDRMDKKVWCWNGFMERSWIDIKIRVKRPLKIILFLNHSFDWEALRDANISCLGVTLKTTLRLRMKGAKLTAIVPEELIQKGDMPLRIEVPVVGGIRPCDLNPEDPDTRVLAVSLSRFIVRPIRSPWTLLSTIRRG